MQEGFKLTMIMKRTFVAISIIPDEGLKDITGKLRKALKDERISWPDEGNIHITLAFLGDTPDSRIPLIKEAIAVICNNHSRFGLAIRGIGVFRSQSDPRVIWAGVDAIEKLNSLRHDVAEALRKLEVPIDDRKFSPHITLGRIKNIKDAAKLNSLVEQYALTEFQNTEISELVFYESILMQTGAVYRPLGIYPLKKPA